jgi:hypothetical protein
MLLHIRQHRSVLRTIESSSGADVLAEMGQPHDSLMESIGGGKLGLASRLVAAISYTRVNVNGKDPITLFIIQKDLITPLIV